MTTATGNWYHITNVADAAKIYVYDEIQCGSAAAFVAELNRITGKRIDVYVNSPGGCVHDGIAVYNALRRSRADVTTIVDGIAASAASVIVQGGRRRAIAKSAAMMIHQASGVTVGRREDHESMAASLAVIDRQIASVYADRSKRGTVEDWLAAMREDKWLDAEAAVGLGLADEITQFVTTNCYTSSRVFASAMPPISRFRRPPAWARAETRSPSAIRSDPAQARRDIQTRRDLAAAFGNAGADRAMRDLRSRPRSAEDGEPRASRATEDAIAAQMGTTRQLAAWRARGG